MRRLSLVALASLSVLGVAAGFVAVSNSVKPNLKSVLVADVSADTLWASGQMRQLGWRSPHRGCSWSSRQQAQLKIPLRVLWSGKTIITINYRPFLHKLHKKQSFRILLGNEYGSDFRDSGVKSRWTSIEVRTPGGVLDEKSRHLTMVFDFEDAVRPSDLGIGTSGAQLGICLRSVQIHALVEEDA